MRHIHCIFIAIISIALYSCTLQQEGGNNSKSFISLEDGKFYDGEERFYPLILNYIVAFQATSDGIVLGPTPEYDHSDQLAGKSKAEVLNRLKAHFVLIRDMGFNTVRLLGLDRIDYEKFYPEGGMYYFETNYGKVNFDESLKYFNIEEDKQTLHDGVKEMVRIADEVGVRLLITFPRPRSSDIYNQVRMDYLSGLISLMKDDASVFAYDFFNEPLYFDNAEFTHISDIARTKQEAYRLVLQWKRLMESCGSKQLLTISFAEPIEVFEWDASILPIDFASIHSYNPLRVPNEIYWYNKYLDKPWLISETALPADGDSISYYEQLQFMKEAVKRAEECNSQGFVWWKYQEVNWGHPEHNYTSLLNHKGISINSEGDTIYGGMKPAAKYLSTYNYQAKENGDCYEMVNYRNNLGYDNYLIRGRILNKHNNQPIEGAIIRGWTNGWVTGINTYTDQDGYFECYSNDRLIPFEVSAFGMKTEKFYLEVDYQGPYEEADVKNRDLIYKDLIYTNYLNSYPKLDSTNTNSDSIIIFNFKSSLFSNYKFEAEFPVLYLDSLELNYAIY